MYWPQRSNRISLRAFSNAHLTANSDQRIQPPRLCTLKPSKAWSSNSCMKYYPRRATFNAKKGKNYTDNTSKARKSR